MKQIVSWGQFSGTPKSQLSELYEAKRFTSTVSSTPRARQNRNFPSVFETQQPDSRRGLLGHDFRRHCGALKIEEKEERERERGRRERKKKEREREREKKMMMMR